MKHSNTAISVKDLEKSYGDLHVLEQINFVVERGSIFALLGSNGAGKTTTVNILSTLLQPDSGSARVCGFDVERQPALVREKISMTGQNAAVDEVLTGRENLRMIGALYHLLNAGEKAEELLEKFTLLDAADQPVSTYSGGMRRRLDLAMSLVDRPPVIFLDEPTTGLDPQGRHTMWKIIKTLNDSEITVFLTTQYLEEADRLADQIAILHKGTIIVQGPPTELKQKLPHHIELGFHDVSELYSARQVLEEYDVTLDEEQHILSIATDGSIKQMTNILNRLENGEIAVAEFTQNPPTLEDAFLTIIGENNRKEVSL